MQMPDLAVFKEIPGYRAILKAVLKTQIQSLVEQLSTQTGEESVIVTASLEDGSLTHLGSDFGKVFLDSHDQFKSQFLGFCLKRNQVLQKTNDPPPTSTVRKKGPVAAGRRPRLAPYTINTARKAPYTTTTNTAVRKAPRKTTPRSLQSQKSQYNQTYNQGLEPAYSIVDDIKPGTSTEMKAIVKIEPGLENDVDGEIGQSLDENKIYIENMSQAFPGTSYLGDEGAEDTKDNIKRETGTHSKIGAVNQPGKKRGRPRLKTKIEQDGQQFGQCTSASVNFNNGGWVTQDLRSKRGRKIKMKINPMETDLYSDAAFGDIAERDYYIGANRPFACSQCPKRFKERHHLTYHLRIHSGQRPYTCDVCSKCFTQSSSLNTHKKIHQKEINCGVCGKIFRKMSLYERHVCTSQTEYLDAKLDDGSIIDDGSNHGNGDENNDVIDSAVDEFADLKAGEEELIDHIIGEGI